MNGSKLKYAKGGRLRKEAMNQKTSPANVTGNTTTELVTYYETTIIKLNLRIIATLNNGDETQYSLLKQLATKIKLYEEFISVLTTFKQEGAQNGA